MHEVEVASEENEAQVASEEIVALQKVAHFGASRGGPTLARARLPLCPVEVASEEAVASPVVRLESTCRAGPGSEAQRSECQSACTSGTGFHSWFGLQSDNKS